MTPLTRRTFLAAAPAAAPAAAAVTGDKPALKGGKKTRTQPFAAWPRFDQKEENALIEVLKSGKWYRGNGTFVKKFEESYSSLTGAKHCLATTNGTSALIISLDALGVGPGDEVLIPPYTFIATVNSVIRHHALPVFVDSDAATFQMDHRKVEAAINGNTRAIMPVHVAGGIGNLDAFVSIAAKHKIPLIEDACYYCCR